nr:PREDICTED: uncharacterized protein LOC106702527 [Latimeria chalumnae]|eukprot:XP_014340593.1 PREDICTED: uncharacterized protein LOC106702527 [Latimeria chalumnae]
MDMIGTLESSQKVSWKDYLQTLTHAYNVTRHESTGYSPFFLMFGRHPRLPIDIAFGMTPSMEEEETEYNEYVAQLKNRLRTAHSLAKEFSGRSKDCYKQNYDKKVRADIPVEEGDRVLVQNKLLRGHHKLADRWEPIPYRVVKKQPNLPVYIIRRGGDQVERVLHHNLSTPCMFLDQNTETSSSTTVDQENPFLQLPSPKYKPNSEGSANNSKTDDNHLCLGSRDVPRHVTMACVSCFKCNGHILHL